MKVMVIETTTSGRVTTAVASRDILVLANVLEQSSAVTSFYVDGLNVRNQQAQFGAGVYKKWISPISQ